MKLNYHIDLFIPANNPEIRTMNTMGNDAKSISRPPIEDKFLHWRERIYISSKKVERGHALSEVEALLTHCMKTYISYTFPVMSIFQEIEIRDFIEEQKRVAGGQLKLHGRGSKIRWTFKLRTPTLRWILDVATPLGVTIYMLEWKYCCKYKQ